MSTFKELLEGKMNDKAFKDFIKKTKKDLKQDAPDDFDDLAYEVGDSLIHSVPGLKDYLKSKGVKDKDFHVYIGDAITS